MQSRIFDTYQQALTACYEEEISGAAYFAALAKRHLPPGRAALERFAQIEEITAAALAPLMAGHGFASQSTADLTAEGQAEAQSRAFLDWPDFLEKVVRDYPAFMPEFQQTIDLAPPQDRAALQILLDHEAAVIDYAAAAIAADPKADDHLSSFVTRYGTQS